MIARLLGRRVQPKPPTPEERERFKQFYRDRAVKRRERR